MAAQLGEIREVVIVGGGAQVSGAIAESARAGQHINADLSREDLDRAVAARATAAGSEGDVR